MMAHQSTSRSPISCTACGRLASRSSNTATGHHCLVHTNAPAPASRTPASAAAAHRAARQRRSTALSSLRQLSESAVWSGRWSKWQRVGGYRCSPTRTTSAQCGTRGEGGDVCLRRCMRGLKGQGALAQGGDAIARVRD